MINLFVSNTIRFIFLVLLQVLLLNNIGLYYNLANPYLYVLFIILLPIDIPVFWLFALSFAVGISVDAFSGTIGLHATACVFMAFIRIITLGLLNPRGGSEFYTEPTLRNMGFNRFMTYATVMILAHHLILISVDIFRISEFFYIILRVLSSSIFTLSLVILSQYLFFGRRTKQ